MREKLRFIRLPLVLVFLFFFGRLALGASGAPYETGNRVFSMVILQVHLAVLWAAVGRYRGYRLRDSVQAVVLIVLVSQSLILMATAASYLTGIDTFFNYPAALNSQTPVEFIPAMMARLGGLVGNTLFGAILACLGWYLGILIPPAARAEREQRAFAPDMS